MYNKGMFSDQISRMIQNSLEDCWPEHVYGLEVRAYHDTYGPNLTVALFYHTTQGNRRIQATLSYYEKDNLETIKAFILMLHGQIDHDIKKFIFNDDVKELLDEK